MQLKPLNSEEKASLRNFFETYVVPLLVLILLIWGMSELRDRPDLLTISTILGVVAAMLTVIAGSIYAVVWLISKGWHDGKN